MTCISVQAYVHKKAAASEDRGECQLLSVSAVLRVFTVPAYSSQHRLITSTSDQELFTPSGEESDSRGS